MELAEKNLTKTMSSTQKLIWILQRSKMALTWASRNEPIVSSMESRSQQMSGSTRWTTHVSLETKSEPQTLEAACLMRTRSIKSAQQAYRLRRNEHQALLLRESVEDFARKIANKILRNNERNLLKYTNYFKPN